MKNRYLLACLILTFSTLFRVHSADYFVNDNSTVNDVYTSGVGVDIATNGLISSAPMLTITNLLATYDLEPGDTVYVDAGIYSNYTVKIESGDQGSSTNPVTFKGSTNMFDTVISRNDLGKIAVEISSASFVNLEHFCVMKGSDGIRLNPGNGCKVLNSVTQSNNVNGIAITGGGSDTRTISGCLSRNNGTYGFFLFGNATNVNVQNAVFHEFRPIYAFSGVMSLTNCIIWATLTECYRANVSAVIQGDYNIFYTEGAAVIAATGATKSHFSVFEYQKDKDQEQHSVWINPDLKDPTNADYHLLSSAGRWTGVSWALDGSTSTGVDYGAPASAYGNEIAPNGSRANVGLFGNTLEASKSPAAKSLLATTLNDGGTFVPDTNPSLSDKVYWWASSAYSGAENCQNRIFK